jgi:CBS domain-containing protein
MRVNEIMTIDPASCRADTPLHEVAKLMVSNDCGAIPVVDEVEGGKRIVGVITDRDIAVRSVAASRNPEQATAADAMSHPIVVVTSDALVEDCVKSMETNQLRRLPVVDQLGCLVGMVSQADIARYGPPAFVAGMLQKVSEGFDSAHR